MSLIKEYGLPVYKQASGFKYPEAMEFYEKHDSMVWHKNEISLAQDVKDYANASKEERQFLQNVMKLFTQNDVQAGIGYSTLLNIFKPFEVQAMLGSFNDRESTHVVSYANFTDTVGMPPSIYTEFLEVPIMHRKTEYLDKAKVKKYEEYKGTGLSDAALSIVYRSDIARMLAVYAGGLEGITLMAQFAMLMTYQEQGKYPGLVDTVLWSIKDEMVHLQGNAWLFRRFIEENSDIWNDELKYDIYQAIREIVAYEEALIDYLDPPHVNKNLFKDYVKYMADNALKELGMKSNWGINKTPLLFMEDITAPVLADFFSTTVTEYSKNIKGSWAELR